ncbi:MAG: hypothetical protein GWM92_12535 [Gemmatimonadetes bacterium]|nr:hypothetical protein [Gemmatimonadota bacterium]NIR79529.1 hypothetical protein [Gemmatimonadota bacterium]NIT88205.1 hypothetical protein [Gemmatimonadota bacterium]NIU32013.1 hypothetical protein [Gemmatimonadota bacterium]NIU36622.1 hypothetical protein [Gemmatimonadota bacterium]
MDSLFEALFKYRPLLFERGELALSTPWPVGVILAAGAALAAVAILTYLRPRGDARLLDRGVMAGLRLLALAVVLLCLLQPTLVLRSTIPQRNFVAVLVDASQSMGIGDEAGEPRRSFVDRELSGTGAPLLASLSERFSVRLFGFGDEPSRIEDPASLGYRASVSRLAPGLDRVRQELEGVPLSGVVVVSDGGVPAGDGLDQALLRLRGSGVPVYTVGVGTERVRPDVQVSRVEMPRRILRGSAVSVDVVLGHAGLEGRTVPLRVEEEGVLVEERTVTLPAEGEPAVVRLHLRAEGAGDRLFRFSVPDQAGEPVTRNNAREVLASVEERTEKILFVEGRPRFEVKFLRRAVADDELLQVVLLQRTADDKFLRLDVDDADELAGGFPRTREELFRYRALILGSVEASFFTADQLRMIGDFVARRGGTLLALGGPDSFAEGSYGGTPVADALPVRLDETRPMGGGSFLTELEIAPTPAGREHAALQLEDGEVDGGTGGDTDGGVWAGLPPLTSVNPIREIKPGASALLVGRGRGLDGELVVLASQRYGRGRALALAVQDTWIWQMHADIGVDDLTHERFWRQLLRWTVAGVPERVTLRPLPTPVEPGRAVELVAEVSDSAFLRVNDARVRAVATGPGGEAREIPLTWDGEEDGIYRGSYVPGEAGVHRVVVEADGDGGGLGSDALALHAGASPREYFDAGMDAGLLRRVAEETGGRFYTPATASRLAEDLTYTGGGITVTEERDLWDMPALFLLLILLVGAEWGFRRARGLA